MQLPAIDDVHAARQRLDGLLFPTRLTESPLFNEQVGGRVLFKPEVLQRTGSFKFRGAYNKIAATPEADRKRGVVGFSSGNHAQGIAAAAAMFGVEAVIVMPSDAPAIKVANVKRMGGKVVLYDRFGEDRTAIARPFVDRGMTLVPPYEDPLIIAGQGTIGLEILEEAQALGAQLDAVVIPCGGGGLSSGIALAVKHGSPDTDVWIAEPENFDDTVRSLAAGHHVSNEPGHRSICDAILTSTPGYLTFEINRKLLAGGVAVSEAAVKQAMRDAAQYLKLVVEPGGSAAFAALSSGKIDLKGRTVVVVLSGGNVDLAAYAAIVGESA